MLYLSKGMIIKESISEQMRVNLCGIDYVLSGIGARLWLNGRWRVHEVYSADEVKHLHKLQELGLVEISEDTGSVAAYALLTHCIICPAQIKQFHYPKSKMEKSVWIWISQSGLRLTIGELVKLFDSEIIPDASLLGKANAQELTLAIYSPDIAFDSLLEIQMEKSVYRDEVVAAVLGLLKKKHIILL